MAENESERELSGDEVIDNIGEFHLININANERNALEKQCRHLVGDSDDDDEFEGFEAADVYTDRNFDNWVKTEFSERVGPTRIFDTSAKALEYFELFYNDGVFMTIVNYINLNANRKCAAEPNHKCVWTDVTLSEIKAYYGLTMLMDIMKFERDELYWTDNKDIWVIGSKF